ncbi:MAG: sigma-70 family RNA polymerase sigma factor [Gemmataceae bacterium]
MPAAVEPLLTAARAGDPTAWGRLLEHYRPYLSLLAEGQVGRRLRVKADPADLVQEAFLQAHRCFADFRGTSAAEFLDWLQAILASRLDKLVRRYYGTQARDVRREDDLALDLSDASKRLDRALAAPGSSPSGRAADREEAVRAAAALDGLSADHRRVIVLRQLEGRPFPEVGALMGRSAGAATQLWMRAVNELQARLGVEP